MTSRIIVIENLGADGRYQPAEISDFFESDRWILVNCHGLEIDFMASDGLTLSKSIQSERECAKFYEKICGELPSSDLIYRIRNPNYPLNKGFFTEIEGQFPDAEFDYVLSTGEECNLEGFFIERFDNTFLRQLVLESNLMMPPGYFCGSARERSGRHWLSLELRQFYYENHFEELFDSPRNISVNTMAQCNYTCLKCQYHSSQNENSRPYGMPMPLDRLQIILEKAADYKRLKGVYPTISGEALMHPDIVAIVKLIKESGYDCGFATNASLLTPQLTDQLLDAGLNGLAFSIDTTSPEKYRILQNGGELSDVESNIIYFRDAYQQERGPFSMSINFVVSSANEDEIGTFRQRWLDRGFNVQFSTEHDFRDQNMPYFVQEDWAPDHRMPCWALWQGLYLTEEGRLVSCGTMAKSFGARENIFDMSAYDLWRCKALDILRKQQLTGVKPGYCKEFTCWTGQMNTWSFEDDALKCRQLGGWQEMAQPQAIDVPQPTQSSNVFQGVKSVLKKAIGYS